MLVIGINAKIVSTPLLNDTYRIFSQQEVEECCCQFALINLYFSERSGISECCLGDGLVAGLAHSLGLVRLDLLVG